ncbi:MAG: carboxypeptidase regulatory-like domain-containing protein [Planctomycetes bacterium]|nr:carboxypeptidase regulatory-like domain-containing protein [Planctomycetota bacterium]
MKVRAARPLILLLALCGLVGLVFIVALFDDAADDGDGMAAETPDRAAAPTSHIRRSAGTRGGPRYRQADDGDDWVPYGESDEERKHHLVRARISIAETGKPLVGADVSLLAHETEKNWRRLFHGRFEEPGLFLFRMPRNYEVDGLRLLNGPDHDMPGAFVPGHYFLQPEPTEEGFDLVLRVSSAPAISGRVVDAATGRFLPGATVTVKGGDLRKPWRATCGEFGAFQLAALRHDALSRPLQLDLVVQAPGHVERVLAVDLPRDDQQVANLEIALETGLRLGGQVVDERGSPCAGLALRLLLEPAPGRAPLRAVEGWYETQADGQGRFLFEGLPAGRRLELRAEGEWLMPLRQRIEAFDHDRDDLLLRAEGGRLVTLDLRSTMAAELDDQVVRVFRIDAAGDWCVLPLDLLDRRRRVLLSASRKEELLIFAQRPGRGEAGESLWQRGRLRWDPAVAQDAARVDLEDWSARPGPEPDAGLAPDCAWGVSVDVALTGGEEVQRIDLGPGRCYWQFGPGTVYFLVAPGELIEFNAAGQAPQRFLVVGEPGSRLGLEARPRPAERIAPR